VCVHSEESREGLAQARRPLRQPPGEPRRSPGPSD
jgi:hypothetical protein